MDCSHFVNRCTDYLDGDVGVERMAMDSHLSGCAACRRYVAVLEQGAALLRSLPEPELGEDFAPRLQHRLYHVDDERMLAGQAASGATGVTVFGMAVLLTAVAWLPVLVADSPVVELDPIVVDRPPQPVRPASALPDGFPRPDPLTGLEEGLWDDALLYEYSPLSQRYRRRAAVRRVGLDRDR